MKWNKKGHEFDREAEKILSIPKICEKCYIFGAGVLGKELLITLRAYNYTVIFLDNSWTRVSFWIRSCFIDNSNCYKIV